MRRIVVVAVVLLAAIAAGWYFLRREAAPGAGGDASEVAAADDPEAPLAFAPADTPYVFANVEPLPAAVTDHWMAQLDMGAQVWQAQLALAIAELERDRPAADELKWLRAFDAELQGKTMAQVFDALGYDLRGRFALYGVGLVPVLRMPLADPARFQAFLGRLEQQVGTSLPRAKVDAQEYLHFTGAGAKLRGIVALQGRHLVLTLAPVGDDAALRELLGLQRPARSVQDGGAIATLNRDSGFLGFGSGYFDLRALVAHLAAAPTPLEQAFLAALGVSKPAIDAVCRAEYDTLAQAVPRLTIGYTRLDRERMDMVSRLETNAAIAADLQTLRAPMPGLAQAARSPFNVGLSLKLGALPGLVGKWADQVAKAPWQCPQLLPLNEAFAQSRQELANPVVFGVAPVFEGVHAIATRIEFKPDGGAPDFGGKLLIGSPNPASLVAMAKGFVPQLASLQLAPDGKVQALPALPDVPGDLPTFVAMNQQVLGLAFGAGEDKDLPDYLTADPAQQPLLVLGYSGALFAQFNEQMLAEAAAAGDPAKLEEQKRMAEMIGRIYGQIERAEIRVEFGERGIEMHQSATLN